VTALLNINPPIIAHRGASYDAPENTLIAFTKAAQMGIKWVEFDVMLAACGEPIVFHDETLDRTTSGCGNVGDYPYAHLRSLDAGGWFNARFSGERIPTLAAVLEFLQLANMCANVEIKPLPGQDKATAVRCLQEVERYFPQPNPAILFSSFSVDALRYAREQSADCLLGFLMHDWLDDWDAIGKSLSCVSMNVFEEILTEERVHKIKQAGYLLLTYTVNDLKRANELYAWGVDAVFSDVPDVILSNHIKLP
jgi:glycerophosphoryl diester phosphodiesterase